MIIARGNLATTMRSRAVAIAWLQASCESPSNYSRPWLVVDSIRIATCAIFIPSLATVALNTIVTGSTTHAMTSITLNGTDSSEPFHRRLLVRVCQAAGCGRNPDVLEPILRWLRMLPDCEAMLRPSYATVRGLLLPLNTETAITIFLCLYPATHNTKTLELERCT